MVRPSSRPASLALQCFVALLVVALVRPPVAQASPPQFLTAVSLGASGPRIAVVVVSQDLRASQQQGALEGAAEAALERAARFTVIPVHDAFNPTAAKKQEARLEESRASMKAGRHALDDLDNVKATEAFTQALQALQEADLSRNFPALLEAWTMKAAGHATGGENGPAKKDIEAVVALAPKAEFSPTYFPPDLIKFAEAQRKFAANAKGELLVRTEPPGARVWVDGTFRGVSPVTVAGLTGAKHFIAASEGGYAFAQSQAGPGEEVLSLAAAEIGPGWKKAITEIKKDPEGSTRDSAAQALGKAAQLDQLVVVLAKKSLAGEQLDLIALRLEVRDGHNASFRAGTVNPGDPEQLATFFDGLTGKDARRDGKDPVHHFKGGGSSQVKTIAGISLLGFGAAALITGGVFGILASDQASIYRTTPQTQTVISANAKSSGTAFAAVADISYIVGLLAAGTGGVLLITNNGGGGAEEATSAPGAKKGGTDDAKRRELDRKAAEDRRAAEERAREDERRREEERKREEDRKKEGDSKAADDKRREEEEEARKKEEEEARKKEEEASSKKLTKKEREALEKKKRDEEKQAAAEEKKRLEEEERAKKAEEKKGGKLTRKQREEEERRKKEEEEQAKLKAEEEARLKAEAEAQQRKKDEEERKKREKEEKRRKEAEDDLRNF
ncbi:MAG: PEGA domain-containing protein [Archangium sp.]|nr:PEGA domain-containing protein [Archangium sp.]